MDQGVKKFGLQINEAVEKSGIKQAPKKANVREFARVW